MQAKQLHEVLARVVAWHNRHPLALRISPTQVHSIGGVALPFASAVKPAEQPAPPTLHEVLDPPPAGDAADAFASLVAVADDVARSEAPVNMAPGRAGEALTAQPAPDAMAEPAPAPEATPEAQAGPEPAPAASAEPPALPDVPATAEDATATDADAPIELAMALDEAAAQADADAALAQEPDAVAPAAAAPSDDTPFTGTETQVPPPHAVAGPDAGAAADAALDVDLHADPAADAPLAARLQAARERAMAGAPGADDAGVDIALDGPSQAPLPVAQALAAGPASPPAAPASRSGLARLWAGLPLGWIRRRGRAQQAAAGAGTAAAVRSQGRLAPLFSRDFMWPRTPRQVARWVQRHGAEAPLAPPDWPQRQVETDAALLQAARRQGLPHAVTRHVLTAAIGVGDRRIRLLIDDQGRILGPRALDRRRIGLLGSGGAALAAGVLAAMLGPWRHVAPHADDEAAVRAEAAASAASAAVAQLAASAASATLAAASAAASAASDAAAGEAHADHAAHDAPPEAHAAAAPAPAGAHSADHDGDAHGVADGSEPASAAPLAAASAPASVVTITQEPPPRWPVTRASGPLVAIRLRLSDEAKAAARAEVAAARSAMPGTAAARTPAATAATQPTQGPGAPPRLGPQETAVRVAQQPGTVYAVVTPAMPQRESAEAILAQMMSVRARIPAPVPDHGEVMAHQGRWRAAWWPFATLAEAERARAMLVARGMRAEVIEF